MSIATRLTVGIALAALSAAGASTPASAQVSINIGIGPTVPVAVVAQPPAYYYGNHYYRYDKKTWFESERNEGPWGRVAPQQVPRQVQALPKAYARMPHNHVQQVGPAPWSGH
jgi:hypothetical protein